MRITVMGVLMVIGGILLLAFFVDHIQRNLSESREHPTQPKPANNDEQPNLS